MKCTLCYSETTLYFNFAERNTKYFRCETCRAILMDPQNYPDRQQEIARYTSHNNDITDPGYQKFVMPLVKKVIELFGPESAGLDFGAGTGPVITKLLRDRNYKIHSYDPLFENNPMLLKMKYDYIVSCEVIEHFHHPAKEFKLLRRLLKDSGALILKTDVFTDDIDFASWYYKNDETHVIFYHPETLEYIKSAFGFSSLERDGRHICFQI